MILIVNSSYFFFIHAGASLLPTESIISSLSRRISYSCLISAKYGDYSYLFSIYYHWTWSPYEPVWPSVGRLVGLSLFLKIAALFILPKPLHNAFRAMFENDYYRFNRRGNRFWYSLFSVSSFLLLITNNFYHNGSVSPYYWSFSCASLE